MIGKHQDFQLSTYDKNTVQIFLQYPNVFQIMKEKQRDLYVKKIRNEFKSRIFAIHGSFLIHFKVFNLAIKNMFVIELQMAKNIGAKYYIVHFGRSDDFDVLSQYLQNIPKQLQSLILFENVPFLYDNLLQFIKQRNELIRLGLGMCLDISHLVSSGLIQDISDKKELTRILFNNGKCMYNLLHLNDQFAQGKDIHCEPFDGYLFGKNLSVDEKLLKIKHLLAILDHFDDIVLEFGKNSDKWIIAIKQYKNDNFLSFKQLTNIINLIYVVIQNKNNFQSYYYQRIQSFLTNWMRQSNSKYCLDLSNINNYHIKDSEIQTIKQLSFLSEILTEKQIPKLKQPKILNKSQVEQCVKQLIIDLQIDEYVICGSYRRAQIYGIEDIDILIPVKYQLKTIHLLNQVQINNKAKIKSKGKITRFDYLFRKSFVNVDLVFYENHEYAPALLYFSGSKYFNIFMRKHAKKLGISLGNFNIYKNGEIIQTSNEREIFQLLGLQYVKPKYRI